MTGDVVNLRQFRKRQQRTEKENRPNRTASPSAAPRLKNP